MYIALSDKLLNEFFNFKKGTGFDKEIIPYLFKYLQPFSITREQLESLNLDVAIKSKIMSGGDIISPSSATNQNNLINSTLYKIMLTDDKNDYPYVNILSDEIEINYTATYKSGENRDKVKNHMKKLLSNVSMIIIVDKYLSPPSNPQWNKIFNLLKYILPNQNVTIKIYYDRENSMRDIKNLLETFNNKWYIDLKEFDNSIHDRYIETDKLKIVLSSGFLNLANTNKDFTYIVKEKEKKC